MRFFFRCLPIFGIFLVEGESRSMTDLVCQINPKKCSAFKSSRVRSDHGIEKVFRKEVPARNTFGAPSAAEFQRWNTYEETAQGTGFLVPNSGFANGIPYGPGLGDIAINTGVGVQHPFGGIGIERNFGLSMGGNGRIGGIPVGWGNGGYRSYGSAPWANP